jgi:hypothetical protein
VVRAHPREEMFSSFCGFGEGGVGGVFTWALFLSFFGSVWEG